MREVLNQEILLEARDAHSGLLESQTRHIQPALEESPFFNAKDELAQLKMLPVLPLGFLIIHGNIAVVVAFNLLVVFEAEEVF